MTELIIPNESARVEPRPPGQVNSEVLAEYEKTVRTWGIPNNLIRTMAAMPQLALTEVDYANAFIFDVDKFCMWPQPGNSNQQVPFPTAGFVDRGTKELVINLVSLLNRSRYSITHHSFIGFVTLQGMFDARKAEALLLHLADNQGKPTYLKAPADLYTPFQIESLKLAEKIQNSTGHGVSDAEIVELRQLMRQEAAQRLEGENERRADNEKLPVDAAYTNAYIDGMLVELTWCICHFGGLLNKWFTVLRVRDEDYPVAGGNTFVQNYEAVVPESIKQRNNAVLGANGWG
jgi:hypothetical protein